MTKRLIITFILTLALITGTTTAYASSHHYYTSQTFSNGLTAKYVLMNLPANEISVGVGTANSRILSADTLKNISSTRTPEGKKAFASINGTYFSAYNGVPLPYGTMIDNGRLLHVGNYGAVLGITADKRMVIDNLNVSLIGKINGEHRFTPWGLNHPREEAEAIMIFTPDFSDQTHMPQAKNIVVSANKVVQMTSGSTSIPADGFVIAFNPGLHSLTDRFTIGDTVTYETEYTSSRPGATPHESDIWKEVVYAVGAGPSIIINGAVTADGTTEGFTEAKINTQKAQRSFIGYREDGRLIMGTVAKASIKDLALICTELNLKSAINLDGGASSGLMYYDSYKTTPGRNLNNALMFFE